MIKIVVFKNSQGIYKGFKSLGHAEYDEYGQDIVCSAASVLILNTINAIESFTQDQMKVTTNQDKGFVEVVFKTPLSEKATVLMDAMVLGLKTIQEEYTKQYIHLKIKEV